MRQRSHNSDLPLVPEDVSAGGFKVLVTSEPHLNKEIECSIQVSDKVFDNCAATIVWAHENGDGTWYTGINIDSLTEDRNFLDMTLNKANETMK